ncbi:MAG: hybrid sensor histidine kinase/response regulator [Polyangiales bacterium]
MTTESASEERFRKLVEGAPDGVVISREGLILYANAAALRLLGYESAGELVGKPMTAFLDGESVATMRRRLQQMRQTGEQPTPREYPAKRRDGSTVIAEISSIFIDYEGGPAVLAFARDVTERVRLRAQLEHANRLAALGMMAGGVAHEINNPLAFVSLAAELLERHTAKAPPDEDVRTLVRDIRIGVGRIATVARDLRLYARHEDEPIGPVDLGEVLDSAARIVGHELRTRVHLRIERPENLPAVLGVDTRLEQVFVNLLLNAAYAIDENRTDGEIVIRVEPRERDVLVEVRDNGSGMNEELLSRIFEPFFTTRPAAAGTGLGLSISRDIVLRVGGTITATSIEGSGSTMRVTLVREGDRAAAAMALEAIAPESPDIPRRRILVIDDEPLVVSMIARTLGDRHDVVGEVTARDGLARALDEPFDLVLCDLMMPELSGMELHAQVAKKRPGLEQKFVFVTGGSFTRAAREFLDAVPNGRIMKPFSSSDLEPWLLHPPA